ncbi:MAG: D-alanyl-D-alanine carboxypeptidase/D-alanyl-D-alanine-endopeptidase, partial [Chitinophagaceae bacterium]|nr:D-alanyl-D-alanine carboxypeptidase/D-alanyl-D-alanine-endopeptidase [Chitinophagaceae bacterium]
MRKIYGFACLLCYCSMLQAQGINERLRLASDKLLADSQLKHGILGLCVVKSETGEKIFEVNAQTGLAPASCQKTITSAAAMEILGPSYRYQTVLGYTGTIGRGSLNGDLILIGSGDPSLGSWRYDSTKEAKVLGSWMSALQQQGIRKITGNLVGYNGKWETETLPGGWIWDDMGNYYGAGSAALNWRENQYDLVMRSGNTVGDTVEIVAMKPKPFDVRLRSQVLGAAKGTGDNAYIYLPPFSHEGVVRGTIPIGESSFAISGSFPDPAMQVVASFHQQLDSAGIAPKHFLVSDQKAPPAYQSLLVYQSPTFDSLNYWFLKRSINLYGEVFVKTIAYEKTGFGSADEGLKLIRQFWKERGIETSALHMIDGSGLSPQNRVTADALVKVLQYARSRPWFHYYYDALPVFNQMKLKSGTIGGAKSFAGYHT